jgi:DMSO/TMAO reductase YedYZ molybdopterin-dependent catalytic subunit
MLGRWIKQMFAMDQTKTQSEEVPQPKGLDPSIIVSDDTHRANRIPPGQSRTLKWPILDANGAPAIDLANWKLVLSGCVQKDVDLTWDQFLALPRVKVFSDFHCVTRWSRLGNLWEGVSTRTLVDLAGGLKPEARFVLAYGYDYGWTTNLPVDEFLSPDALVAISHDGEPLSAEHGGPARLIIPKLYAWKSAKWLGGLEFLENDKAGFWERNGYHMNGDPWREERFGNNW